MKKNIHLAIAVLVCTCCVAPIGVCKQAPGPSDEGNVAYMSAVWAELMYRDGGWRITGTRELAKSNPPLHSDDLVLQIDGLDVSHMSPLSVASLLEDAYWRDVTVTIQRQQQKQDVHIRVGQPRPDDYMAQFYQRFGIGATIVAQKPAPTAKIADVIPGSPADLAGVKEGDELLAVDDHPVAGLSVRDIVERVTSSTPVPARLRIRRGAQTLDIEVHRTPISRLYRRPQPANIEFPMQTGLNAPTFKFRDLGGAWVSLEDFRGKWILLTFWASWCVPCQREAAILNKLARAYPTQLVVLALDVDDKRESVDRFVAANQVAYRVLLAGNSDDPVGKSYNVRGIPVNVIVRPDGNITYVEKGFSAASPLEDYVRKVVSR